MFGTSYVGFGSDPTYTQKIMKIPDIAWPTFFDSYRESMLRSKFLSCQAYQDAANHVFETRKDNCFRNYEVVRVLIKYNGITRKNIEENIEFYRVVRVVPPKNYV